MNNKRIISGLLAVTMAMSSTAVMASADFSAQPAQPEAKTELIDTSKVKFGSKYSYTVNADNKTITIVDVTEKALSGSTLKIPTKIDGKKVTGISSTLQGSIYNFYKKLKVVDIPKTVKDIDNFLPFGWWYEDSEIDLSKITISCYKNTAAEKFAATANLKCTLKDANKNHVLAAQIKKTVGLGKNSVKFKWNKVSNATGYRVFRYNNETMKWEKLADLKASVLSYKDSKCDRNAINYYTVRAFRKSGGKTYWANYSGVKGIRCMPTTAPKITSIKSVKEKSDDGVTYRYIDIEAPGVNRGDTAIQVEIKDPNSKEWVRFTSFYVGGTDSNTCRLYKYPTTVDGVSYDDYFEKGKTYNIRMRYCNYVTDNGYRNDENGYMYTFSGHNQYGKYLTKSVKVK